MRARDGGRRRRGHDPVGLHRTRPAGPRAPTSSWWRPWPRAWTAPCVAEGRYASPEQVRAAFAAGAFAVVVGTAITDPVALTQRLAAGDRRAHERAATGRPAPEGRAAPPAARGVDRRARGRRDPAVRAHAGRALRRRAHDGAQGARPARRRGRGLPHPGPRHVRGRAADRLRRRPEGVQRGHPRARDGPRRARAGAGDRHRRRCRRRRAGAPARHAGRSGSTACARPTRTRSRSSGRTCRARTSRASSAPAWTACRCTRCCASATASTSAPPASA